ncbi:hypothetical protein [Streptosporangium canum]|uniref:hypothetical protein n=1 Tax=Streptosporangium canum TaxID=324952 RepID=UPI0033B65461
MGRPGWADDDRRRLKLTAGQRAQRMARRCPQAASARHHFLRNKRTEWREYRRQVTEFELGRYLPVL